MALSPKKRSRILLFVGVMLFVLLALSLCLVGFQVWTSYQESYTSPAFFFFMYMPVFIAPLLTVFYGLVYGGVREKPIKFGSCLSLFLQAVVVTFVAYSACFFAVSFFRG